MSTTTVAAISGKITARIASIHIDPACNTFLNDCFRQFGITVVPAEGDPILLLNRQKFEACVLRLYDPEADRILKAARNSPSNRRLVIYGIARNTQEALRYSTYGINAVLDEPLDRQSVLKVVRATHLLVIHELRRYVRIPMGSSVEIDVGGQGPVMATTVEVSSGGISIRCLAQLPKSDPIRVLLNLPGVEKLTVRASVCWYRESDKVYGIRFDSSDERRLKVRAWIDQYLEIV
ncbi:MAG TPA: PilZ domain-containing protein [Candidatus Dormibacteraeota bacterium]|nr:PilZ domain-containing protein [Candidatus Dormibacteraeota bacterium]